MLKENQRKSGHFITTPMKANYRAKTRSLLILIFYCDAMDVYELLVQIKEEFGNKFNPGK